MNVNCLVDSFDAYTISDINGIIKKPDDKRNLNGRYLFSAEQIINIAPIYEDGYRSYFVTYRYYDYQARQFEEALKQRKANEEKAKNQPEFDGKTS